MVLGEMGLGKMELGEMGGHHINDDISFLWRIVIFFRNNAVAHSRQPIFTLT